MSAKPTYEELEQSVKDLQKEVIKRKQAEKALEESEERFRLLYERAPLGYQSLDEQGHFLEVNQAWLDILGYTREEVIDKSFADFLHPEWRDHFKHNFPRFKAVGEILGVEFEMMKKDGTFITVNFNGKIGRDDKGAFKQTHCILHDITAQKRSEEALKERESLFSQMFEQSTTSMCLYNPDGTVNRVNNEFCKMFGVEAKALINAGYNVFKDQATIDAGIIPLLRDIFEERKRQHWETNFDIDVASASTGTPTSRTGKIFIEVFGYPVLNREGNLEYVVLQHYDINSRKQAEEEMRESENRLRTTLDAAPFPVVIVDTNDEKVHFWSQSALKLFGHTAPTASEWYQLAYPDPDYRREVIDRWKPFLDIARESGQPVNTGEYRVTCKDGSVRICEIYATFLPDNLIVTFNDITERKQADRTLREGRAKLKAALESMTDAVFISDVKGQFIDFNEAFATFHRLGNKSECLKALTDWPTLLDVYLPDGTLVPLDMWAVSRALRGETETNAEYTLQRKDTGETWIGSYSFAPIRGKGGVIVGSVVVARDITEQKHAQDELEKQKILFETMFNTVPDGVVITNTRREIQLANKGMESTFGYKPEELLGKPTKILYSDETKYIETGAAVFNRNAEKPDQLYVTRYRDKNGREFSGETFGAKLFDENHEWIGNLGIMRDITEREQAELRIRQSQKMESIGNLAGGIAHEFNNVLGIIMGNAELAIDDVPDWNPAKESLKEIRKASLRGKDVVRQILSFARKTMTALKPLEINTVVKESLKLMRASIPTMVDIQPNIPSEPNMIMGDPTEIHQIVINLCTNAAHAMKASGGMLEVAISEVTLDKKTASRYEDLSRGDFVKLSVQDSGEGISPDVLEKVFEPYFTTKEFGEGSGMGLAVVYGLVKKCKGAINVESAVGEGTTVTVLFPKIEEELPAEKKKEDELPTGNERILLVDDDPSIVSMIRQMLERLGYIVTSMTDSTAVLEEFKSRPDDFDLVITDMAMPNMSGDQLAAQLIIVREDIPILLCTGHSDTINEKKARRIGIKGFAMKPFDKSKLARAVRAVLDDC